MSAGISIVGDTKVIVNSITPAKKLNFLGAGVSVVDNPAAGTYDITIAGGGGGSLTNAANVGSGTGTIFRDLSPATTINLKSIAAGSTKLSVTNHANDVTLDVVESNLTLANQAGTIGDAKISDLTYSKLTSVPSTFTPSAHASTHLSGGTDPIAASTTSARGTVQLATSAQTTAGLAVQASDTRLSDARVPTAHKTSHQSGGTDAIPLDTLAVPTDITTLNATTSAHGLLKKLDNTATHYMDGTGNWSTPSGGGGVSTTPLAKGTSTKSGDGTTKVFTIVHSMTSPPVYAEVVPTSIDALGSYVTTFDATNITITYQVAPPTGTSNLTYEWMAMDSNGGGGSVLGNASAIVKGTALKSGNSSTKVFTIAHGMLTTPVIANVVPTSTDALGDYITAVDATNITITYSVAPPTGTNNLTYFWSAMDLNGGGVNAGEVNTASNVGTGAGWFKAKTAYDLAFKSAVAGSNKLSITNNTNDLTLDVAEANLTLSNIGGSVTTGQLPSSVLTDTNTKTVTNKTIDSISNTLPNLGSYNYEIYKSGSIYYLRDTSTGIVTSNVNPDSLFQTALTNGGFVSVKAGTYTFSNSFTGLDFPVSPIRCWFTMDPNAFLTVPNGYSGYVFRMKHGSGTTGSSDNKLIGGFLQEAGSIARNWEGVRIEGSGASVNGVYHNTVEGMQINFPNIGIRFYIDSTGTGAFINSNYIKNNIIYGAKTAFTDFDMQATYTAGVNGFYRNRFEYNIFQATNGTDATTGYRNIRHKDNLFIGCYVADLSGSQVSASIHADAQHTVIIGGSMTAINYVDNSTTQTTKIIDENKGIQTNKLTPANGNNIDIIPASTTTAISLWDSGSTKRMVFQKNSSDEVHFTAIKQTAGGTLMPVVFDVQDVPGSTLTESFRVDTDATLKVKPSKLVLRNSSDSFNMTIAPQAITADRILQIPAITGTDIVVTQGFTQTLSNKTLNLSGNSVTDTSQALGDLAKNNGTKFVRFGIGGANTVLAVNSGATDLAYTSVGDANIGTHTTTKITTSSKSLLNSAIVYNDQTNTFGAFAQIFPTSQLKLLNPAGTFSYIMATSAIAADRTVTWPLLTGNDQVTMDAFATSLTNKTITAASNTITDTSATTGDILRHNGTRFVRKGVGTGLQVLRTNSGATDIEWASLTAENAGIATASGNGSTTVFNIAHSIGSTPTVYMVSLMSLNPASFPFTYTADATNIVVTFSTAPTSGTNNVKISWRAVA